MHAGVSGSIYSRKNTLCIHKLIYILMVILWQGGGVYYSKIIIQFSIAECISIPDGKNFAIKRTSRSFIQLVQ